MTQSLKEGKCDIRFLQLKLNASFLTSKLGKNVPISHIICPLEKNQCLEQTAACNSFECLLALQTLIFLPLTFAAYEYKCN